MSGGTNLLALVSDRASAAYAVYEVRLRFTTQVLGGMPAAKELIRPWIIARTGHDDAATEVQAAEAVAALPSAEDEIEEEIEKTRSVFRRDGQGIYVEARQVHAMLKQAASIAGLTTKLRGSKSLIREGTRVVPERIRFELADGEVHADPDGELEQTGNVGTPQGRRSILTMHEYVSPGLTIEFAVHVLALGKGLVDDEYLATCLAVGQESVGLCARRSQGFGRFEVVRFERR